jgi:hypothetical protein
VPLDLINVAGEPSAQRYQSGVLPDGNEMDSTQGFSIYIYIHTYTHQHLHCFQKKRVEADRMKGFHLIITSTPRLRYKDNSDFSLG